MTTGDPTMTDERKGDASMDVTTLYLEENFTDRKLGSLRRLTPMTGEGVRDQTRPILYAGQAEIMTNMGPMPIQFDIEATTLEQAVAGFGPAAAIAVERTVQQIQEMRRQAASQLVVPGGGGMGGVPGGGLGKIQIP
jgi:hypothetical protein